MNHWYLLQFSVFRISVFQWTLSFRLWVLLRCIYNIHIAYTPSLHNNQDKSNWLFQTVRIVSIEHYYAMSIIEWELWTIAHLHFYLNFVQIFNNPFIFIEKFEMVPKSITECGTELTAMLSASFIEIWKCDALEIYCTTKCVHQSMLIHE